MLTSSSGIPSNLSCFFLSLYVFARFFASASSALCRERRRKKSAISINEKQRRKKKTVENNITIYFRAREKFDTGVWKSKSSQSSDDYNIESSRIDPPSIELTANYYLEMNLYPLTANTRPTRGLPNATRFRERKKKKERKKERKKK